MTDDSLIDQCRRYKNLFPTTHVTARDLQIDGDTLVLNAPTQNFGCITAFIAFFCTSPALVILWLEEWPHSIGFSLFGLFCGWCVGALFLFLAKLDAGYQDQQGGRRLVTLQRNDRVDVHWQDTSIPWSELVAIRSITIHESWEQGSINGRFVVLEHTDSTTPIVLCPHYSIMGRGMGGLLEKLQSFANSSAT